MRSEWTISAKSIFLTLILTLPCIPSTAQQILTESSSGQLGDWYYFFWNYRGNATMTLLDGGRYQAQWNDNIRYGWFGGLGLSPLAPETISYSGHYESGQGGSAWVALYGESTEPLKRFYVLEGYVAYNPAVDGTYYGSYESDGRVYDAYSRWRNVSGINSPWRQDVFSVRRDIQSAGEISGAITLDNHVNAWAQMGVDLSQLDYAILASEGYGGPGHSDITVTRSYGCGSSQQNNTCCSTALDVDGNGEGALFDGASCSVTPETTGWHPANPEGVIAAINVGGLLNAYESDGIWYAPNTYVSGGYSRSRKSQTADGEITPILESAQYGEFSAAVPVAEPSLVSIELGFTHKSEVEDVFDVLVEGKKRLSAVDLREDNGSLKKIWQPAPIIAEVTDGELNIEIVPLDGNGTLSSILVKESSLEPQQIIANERGFFADKYFLYWAENRDKSANLTLLYSNQFFTDWSADTGRWVAGMGWSPALSSPIEYAAEFNPEEDGDAYFGLTGWADNPEVAFYIAESWVGNIPGFTEHRTLLGTYDSDGAQYELYQVSEHPPSIAGGYPAYYSIRKFPKPTGHIAGRINTAGHFSAWRGLGVALGTIDSVLIVTESTTGAGNASVTIEEGSLTCGTRDGVPNCCDISADPDGDGWGVQEGQQCAVTDATHGWHPPNPQSIIAAYNLGSDDPPIQEYQVWYSRYPSTNCDAFYYSSTSATRSGNAIHKSACSGNASLSISGIESRWVTVELTLFETQRHNVEFPRPFDIVLNGQITMQGVVIDRDGELDTIWRHRPMFVEILDGHLDIEIVTENPNIQWSSVLVQEAEEPPTSSSSSSSSYSVSSSSSSLSSARSSDQNDDGKAAGALNFWLLVLLCTLGLNIRPQRREIVSEY